MSDSYTNLKNAFGRHVSGHADRGGVSPLDVLIANASAPERDPKLWVKHVMRLIDESDTTASGFWAAVRLILKKMELKSVEVTAAIETALIKHKDTIDPFDGYEGWRCFVEAGGYLSVNMVNDLDRIRQLRAPLWLDLSILAHRSDSARLGQDLRALVSENLITLRDLKPRIDDLKFAFGQERFISQMRQLTPKFAAEPRKQFVQWIKKKFGVQLDDKEVDPPGIPPHKGVELAAKMSDAFGFVFRRRDPSPLLCGGMR